MPDVINTPIQSLLDLFSSDFRDVSFAGLDVAVLEEAAKRVNAEAEAVARAEAALEAARLQLAEGQETLLAKAQRALAYARIYAEEDAALSERLDAIVLPRSLRRVSRDSGDMSTLANGASESAPARRRARRGEGVSTPALFEKPSEAAAAPA